MKLKKIIFYLFICVLLIIVSLKALTLFYEKWYDGALAEADAIVVLGGGISKENLPTTTTFERTKAASELYFKELASIVILCGGKTEEHYLMTEAGIMEKILYDLDIKLNFALEEESVNTYTAALSVKEKFPQKNKIILVTSVPHHLRARLVFEKQGFEVYSHIISGGIYFKQGFYKKSRQALYETAAIVYYKFKGRI